MEKRSWRLPTCQSQPRRCHRILSALQYHLGAASPRKWHAQSVTHNIGLFGYSCIHGCGRHCEVSSPGPNVCGWFSMQSARASCLDSDHWKLNAPSVATSIVQSLFVHLHCEIRGLETFSHKHNWSIAAELDVNERVKYKIFLELGSLHQKARKPSMRKWPARASGLIWCKLDTRCPEYSADVVQSFTVHRFG